MTIIELLNLKLLHAAADQAREPFLPPDVICLTRDPDDYDEPGPDELRGLHAQRVHEQ